MAGGSITQNIFLEVRFAVLNGQYLPGQILERDELCRVYGCKSATVVDALNALVAEGYLDIPQRGKFGVRTWHTVEINDLLDIRVSMLGLAAARAAERHTELEMSNLRRLSKQDSRFDFAAAEGTEQLVLGWAEILSAIVKMSRVSTIIDMARSMGPNALLRKTIWAQNSGQLGQFWRSLDKVCLALAERAPEVAQTAMVTFVEKTRAPLLKSSDKKPQDRGRPEFPTIARIECSAIADGCVYGAGGREPGLDGRVIPFGIAQGRQ